MSFDALFSVSGTAAMAGWLALAFTPLRWRLTRPLALSVAAALALLYTALIAVFWTQGSGDFSSLDNVAALFEHRGLLLAGWVHYLAFDLLIGAWEREEAVRVGMPRLVLLPCLFLTFMFGPVGWLAFLAARHFTLATHPAATAGAA